jgi:hypothetical protein
MGLRPKAMKRLAGESAYSTWTNVGQALSTANSAGEDWRLQRSVTRLQVCCYREWLFLPVAARHATARP